MPVIGRGHDQRVYILPVEHLAKIFVRFGAAFRHRDALLPKWLIYIANRHRLDLRLLEKSFPVLAPSPPGTDQSEAQTIVSSLHARRAEGAESYRGKGEMTAGRIIHHLATIPMLKHHCWKRFRM